MKKLTALLAAFAIFVCSYAQDTHTCDGQKLILNIKKGTLNKKKPTLSPAKIKEAFPCYTGETGENQGFNCGGGVFYLNHDFYFYTFRDYIEVRTNFKGEISEDLLGKSKEAIVDQLGSPDKIPVYEGDSSFGGAVDIVYLYKTRYGALEVTFDLASKTCKSLGLHYKKIGDIEICW